MNGDDRKAAVRDYKERKVAAGIYAIRAAGECWIGRAPNLATIQNRLWFMLEQGGHTHRGLQAAWRAHGADAFAFEIVEEFEEEDLSVVRDRLLKERLAHWQAALGAVAI